MTSVQYTDETLMAFADGELDAAMAARIAAQAERDPGLADRIDAFRQSRDAVRAAVSAATGPLPDALAGRIAAMIAASDAAMRPDPDTARVVSLADRRRPLAARPALGMALAASVAAVAFGLAGFLLGQQGGEPLPMASLAEGPLAGALARVGSGEEIAIGEGRFRAIASFRDGDGLLCREFELDAAAGDSTLVGVACREQAGWSTRLAVVTPPQSDGYAPASSLDVLDAYLEGIGAGETLSPEAEAAALREVAGR